MPNKIMRIFISKYKALFLIIVFVLCFITQEDVANAQIFSGSGWGLGLPSLGDLINQGLASLANVALTAGGYLVSISGYILNVSIVLTLHIKDFVNSTPAIYSLWRIIRDITGLFFIFYLIYTAIMMMVKNDGTTGYGNLLKNVVIAGILINFSFFITSVAIDASNVVSQAIYNAMIPNQTKVQIDESTNLNSFVAQAGKGQISDIFMNSLKLQKLYDTKGNNLGAQIGDPFKIILIGLTGTVMMVTTSASFLIAALAFVARLVILIFLLAFSSLWFAADIIPQIKNKFNFWGHLSSQLIFMPAYLFLMYVGLTMLNESNILGAADIYSLSSIPITGDWIFPYITLAFNFTIVVIMLNLPLLYGLKMGGVATDKLSGLINKVNAYKVWGNVSSTVGGNTLGRFGAWQDQLSANTRFGNSVVGRAIRSVTTGALASSKYGGDKTWADREKATKERLTRRDEIIKNQNLNKAIGYATGGTIKRALTLGSVMDIKDALKKMNSKQKIALGARTLKDPNIVKWLSSGDFKAISDEKDEKLLSDEDKKEIKDARNKALRDAVTKSGGPDKATIEYMVDEMDGKDLLKVKDLLKNPDVIEHLRISQLETLAKEKLDQSTKDAIKNEIQTIKPSGQVHPALAWIGNNKSW